MSRPSSPEDEAVVAYLVRQFAPGESADPADPCPGENVLMSLAGGRLLPGEQEAFAAHVAKCERCRAIAEGLSRGRVEATRWVKMRPWLVAAGLLLGVAALTFGPDFLSGPRPVRPTGGTTEEALLASAGDLARARPDLFGDFVPVSREERLAAQSPLRAGDLSLLYPVGRILEARPSFRWEAAPDVEDEIALRTAGGELLWRRKAKAPRLEYPSEAPDLEPGVRYIWEVSREGRRVFATASAEERAAFEASLAEIEARVPAPVQALLTAHVSLRREFYGEAEKAARAFFASDPTDLVGRETLLCVLRQLGSSEARDLEEEGGPPR